MANRVPLTRMVLKPYITLNALRGGAFFQDSSDFANKLAQLQNQFIIIGSAEKITRTQERTNGQYRELNADPITGTFGDPVETYPGLTSYSLTVERVALHDALLLEAFGYIGDDLVEQRVPLILQLIRPIPVDPSTDQPISINGKPLEAVVQTFPGCWFDKNTLEFDTTAGDLKIVQSATLITKRPITSKQTL